MMKYLSAALFVTMVSMFSFACSSDPNTGSTIPVAVSLTLTPNSGTAGKLNSISASLKIEDSDKDTNSLEGEIELGGSKSSIASVAIPSYMDVLPVTLSLQASGPGTATVTMWVKDKAGHTSNKVSAPFTFQ